MKSHRSLPALAALAVIMLALTACGGNQPVKAPGEPSATPSPIPVETAAAPIPSSIPSPSPAATEEAQVIRGTGIYIGQIDNHSVEIETEEGPTAFELGKGTENAPELLEMDDAVVFAYVEQAVGSDATAIQRILSSLRKAEGEAPPQGGTLPDNPVKP